MGIKYDERGLEIIMKNENLIKNIEKLRKKLNEVMDPDGKADQQAINTSQKLDELLNEYEKY